MEIAMRYPNISRGVFALRLNRFAARVEINGTERLCHVKNTGRLGELLIAGNTVYCVHAGSPDRKTEWDIVAAEKDGTLFNIDSQAPNLVFAEFAKAGRFNGTWDDVRSEQRYGNSRFDFMLTRGVCCHYVEIKGVTLERNGTLFFPDAPTIRGVKHLRELVRARESGFGASVCFVVQMRGAKAFSPNDDTQPEFGKALRAARDAGVGIYAYDCDVFPDSLAIRSEVKVVL
jgi:sugar fermentation stimulation protein A